MATGRRGWLSGPICLNGSLGRQHSAWRPKPPRSARSIRGGGGEGDERVAFRSLVAPGRPGRARGREGHSERKETRRATRSVSSVEERDRRALCPSDGSTAPAGLPPPTLFCCPDHFSLCCSRAQVTSAVARLKSSDRRTPSGRSAWSSPKVNPAHRQTPPTRTSLAQQILCKRPPGPMDCVEEGGIARAGKGGGGAATLSARAFPHRSRVIFEPLASSCSAFLAPPSRALTLSASRPSRAGHRRRAPGGGSP